MVLLYAFIVLDKYLHITMTMKRPINWFLTETGRKFTFAVISGTGIALTAARFTPNTIFLHKYKDFVQHYRYLIVTSTIKK